MDTGARAVTKERAPPALRLWQGSCVFRMWRGETLPPGAQMDRGGDDELDAGRGGLWGQWCSLLGMGVGYVGQPGLLPLPCPT